jgi:uncharacterized coiled-coil protein SlyX
METASYIKELENKIKEVENESTKKENYIKELENKIKEVENESTKKENYIKELENKINEKESPMECTPQSQTDMGRDSVPKITVHHYATEQDCTDSARREPHTSPTDLDTGLSSPTDLGTGLSSLMEAYISEPNSPADISEMAEPTVKTFASTPTGASEEKSSRKTSCVMDAAVQTTSEAESVTPEEELLASPEEELPEFNSMEHLRQWLGV